MIQLNLSLKSKYDPPVPVKPDATLPDEEYLALCVKLGMVLDMPTYPLHDVIRYLNAKFGVHSRKSLTDSVSDQIGCGCLFDTKILLLRVILMIRINVFILTYPVPRS